MLLSFPFRAFLGMHLTANMRPVSLSWARTTSEKAPLWGKRHRLSAVQKRTWYQPEKMVFNHKKWFETGPGDMAFLLEQLPHIQAARLPPSPSETAPKRSLGGRVIATNLDVSCHLCPSNTKSAIIPLFRLFRRSVRTWQHVFIPRWCRPTRQHSRRQLKTS